MAQPPTIKPTKAERERMIRWSRALTITAVAKSIGHSDAFVWGALRRERVPVAVAGYLLPLGEPPERIPCPRCDRGQTIPVAAIPQRGTAPGCEMCQREKQQRDTERKARQLAERRDERRRNGRPEWPIARSDAYSLQADPGLAAPVKDADRCPECGTARKAQGRLVWCPRRCEAGLALRRAS